MMSVTKTLWLGAGVYVFLIGFVTSAFITDFKVSFYWLLKNRTPCSVSVCVCVCVCLWNIIYVDSKQRSHYLMCCRHKHTFPPSLQILQTLPLSEVAHTHWLTLWRSACRAILCLSCSWARSENLRQVSVWALHAASLWKTRPASTYWSPPPAGNTNRRRVT